MEFIHAFISLILFAVILAVLLKLICLLFEIFRLIIIFLYFSIRYFSCKKGYEKTINL